MSLIRDILARSFSIDLRALAVARIVAGLVLCYEFLYALRFWNFLYSDQSVLPRVFWAKVIDAPEKWSLFLLSSWPGFDYLFLVCGFLAALALTIGFRTSMAAPVVWFLYLSLQQRNPLVLIGGDVWLSALIFWMMFLPIADFYALDRSKKETPVFLYCSAATAGIVLQTSLIYFISGWTKNGVTWSEGSAIELTLHTQFATDLGRHLLEFPKMLSMLTHLVPPFEIVAALALLCPWKRQTIHALMIPALLFMHLSFQASLDLHHFSLVAIANLLCFLPSRFWKANKHPALTMEKRKKGQLLLLALAIAPWVWQPFRVYEQRLPDGLRVGARLIGVDRDWTLFSPDPPTSFSTILIKAELMDGSVISVSHRGRIVDDNKLDSLRSDARFRYWVDGVLFNPKRAELRRSYCLWLAKQLKQALPDERAPKFLFLHQRQYKSAMDPPSEPELFHQELVLSGD